MTAESLTEIFDNLPKYKDEPLHPDLVDWVEDTDIGKCLKHPLVFDILMGLPAVSNYMYAQKRAALLAALDRGDFHQVVFLHERPYRFWAVQQHNLFSETRLLGQVWVESENIWQNLADWMIYFADLMKQGDERLRLMNDDDLEIYKALPESVTVHRGHQGNRNKQGLSWTTDKERAEWFARRFDGPDPRVTSGVVAKSDIIAHFGGRGEDEIVVLPSDVNVTRTRRA